MFSPWLFLLLFSCCIYGTCTHDDDVTVSHVVQTRIKESIISSTIENAKELSYDPELPIKRDMRIQIESYQRHRDQPSERVRGKSGRRRGTGKFPNNSGDKDAAGFRIPKGIKFDHEDKLVAHMDSPALPHHPHDESEQVWEKTIIRKAHEQNEEEEAAAYNDKGEAGDEDSGDNGSDDGGGGTSITSPLNGNSIMNHSLSMWKLVQSADEEDPTKGSAKLHPHRHHHHHHYNRYYRNQHHPKQRQFSQNHHQHHYPARKHHNSHYPHRSQQQNHYLNHHQHLRGEAEEEIQANNEEFVADVDMVTDPYDDAAAVFKDYSANVFDEFLPHQRHRQLFVASLLDDHDGDKLLISDGSKGASGQDDARELYMNEDELIMVDSGQVVTLSDSIVTAAPALSTVGDDGQMLLKVLEHWPIKHESVVEGDLILGGLMMVHEREDSVTCGPIMPQGGIQSLEAMLYTLDRVNEMKLLPDVTLGAHILDDCDKDTYGLEMAVDFIKGTFIEWNRQTMAK